jgi:hypothetical protein
MRKRTIRLSIFLFLALATHLTLGERGLWVSLAEGQSNFLETGWENGQNYGFGDRVEYSRSVAGYYNSSSPPPECGRRYHEIVRSGDYALMIAGYSQASYAYCYYRVFDLNLPVVNGMKISYWIFHSQGSPKISVDGHFTEGTNGGTIRDFNNNGFLTDQNNVRIHPGHRSDPMNEWYYVEVDLSKAAGKTLAFIMFAFDNGNDGFKGQYRAYVDDLKIFKNGGGFPGSITGGFPEGNFGSGEQSGEVTELENWRWSEYFYGHQGIDNIAWQYDSCGEQHNYVVGLHQNDLVEYLMKFGGDYSRLILRGLAARPGPVEMEIYIDSQSKAHASWSNNNNCNEDVAVDIPGVPYGPHAIAIKFVNDYWNPLVEDRNFYLDGLFVTRSPSSGRSVTLAWDPPTTNVDGTPIEDLTGYKIHYGTSSRTYAVSIDVGNVTSYRIDNLPSGTYYFGATAYNSSGCQSEYSNEASEVIP